VERVENARLAVLGSDGRGRGVFALAPIGAGETIERAPVIPFPPEQWEHLERTVLDRYGFDWGEDGRSGAIVLGFGSLYNHSYTPNARYLRRLEEQVMEFVALRGIAAGEEITVNYNGRPDDRSPMWFATAAE
jgi:SET domain-containing protein